MSTVIVEQIIKKSQRQTRQQNRNLLGSFRNTKHVLGFRTCKLFDTPITFNLDARYLAKLTIGFKESAS